MEKVVIALDQGTTSSRCIVFNRQGEILSSAQKEFTQIFPKPGWVEHNPNEIWASQIAVVAEALAKLNLSAGDVASIGITNQRETTICWNKETGEPIYNAIVWQCRRTSEMIDEMFGRGRELAKESETSEEEGIQKAKLREYVIKNTGLIPDAYFSASKIAWILENVDGARELAERGKLLFGTVDTWLLYKLTGGEVHATDYTNASRTMLYNIKELKWDEKLLEVFNIPKSMLPEVKPSKSIFGYTKEDIIGAGVPIGGIAGDQQAALFGQCCFEEGESKNTYGTGCFLLMNTGKNLVESANGLLTTMTATADGSAGYALEGSVFVAGAAIQWLRDEVKMINSAPESEEYAKSVPDSGGVYVVPAFTGLGAPYWNQEARGIICGLTRGSSKAHIIRATLESLAYQTMDVLKAMEKDAKTTLRTLKVDGGASANDFLMQFESDILGVDVVRPKVIETTALGAAYLAGLSVGYWESVLDIKKNNQTERIFTPNMSEDKREECIAGWKDAVGKINNLKE